jgi:alcohol-forming fatty acyl-CoA reductase
VQCINQQTFSVLSAYREPLRGWVDGWNGPTGVIAAAGKGIFRTMLCNGAMVADLVPVDLVINLLVCAAWHTATSRQVHLDNFHHSDANFCALQAGRHQSL